MKKNNFRGSGYYRMNGPNGLHECRVSSHQNLNCNRKWFAVQYKIDGVFKSGFYAPEATFADFPCEFLGPLEPQKVAA